MATEISYGPNAEGHDGPSETDRTTFSGGRQGRPTRASPAVLLVFSRSRPAMSKTCRSDGLQSRATLGIVCAVSVYSGVSLEVGLVSALVTEVGQKSGGRLS